jgi:hypothetical protein
VVGGQIRTRGLVVTGVEPSAGQAAVSGELVLGHAPASGWVVTGQKRMSG